MYDGSEIVEGLGNVQLGFAGDFQTAASNPTLHTLFGGNKDYYNLWGTASGLVSLGLTYAASKFPTPPVQEFVPTKEVSKSDFNFADDYDAHLIKGNGTVNTNRSRAGVNGAHNEQYFTRYLDDNGGRILSQTEHPTVKGIYEIKYEVYSSSMNNGQGGYRKFFTPKNCL